MYVGVYLMLTFQHLGLNKALNRSVNMITLKQNIKIISVVCGLILCAFNHLMAQTWLGTTDSKWETVSNWSTGKLPASSSTVTFDNDGNNRRTLQLGSKTYCKNLKCQTPQCASYQFGTSRTQRLWLINSGTFTIDADVINNQTSMPICNSAT